MPKFSVESMNKLETVHTDLQLIMLEVIKQYDIKVICGLRGEEEQNEAYEKGYTQLQYPNSRHNRSLILNKTNVSDAVDVVPYPINWNDLNRFYYMAGLVMGIASRLLDEGNISHTVRWGGDWDGDGDFNDNSFNDLVHFELELE